MGPCLVIWGLPCPVCALVAGAVFVSSQHGVSVQAGRAGGRRRTEPGGTGGPVIGIGTESASSGWAVGPTLIMWYSQLIRFAEWRAAPSPCSAGA